MTFEQTQRLMTMLHMNYATFLPRDVRDTALKINLWAKELETVNKDDAEAAFRAIIRNCEFAPTLNEFLSFAAAAKNMRASGQKMALTVDSTPRYTADPDHIERVMQKLYRELK